MRVGSRVLSFLVVLFSLLVITTTSFAAIHTTATPKARITARVDDSKRTILHGHVPAAVHGQNVLDMGRVPANTPVEHLIMVLKSDEDQKREIRKVIDEQQDKHAKNFHQWATPEEFGEHFGVHDADIAQITAWLGSHGLTVEGVNKSKRVLHFSGTIGQVEKAFQTEMHYLAMPNGETHVSNTRDITVPTALSSVIGGVPTLNDFFKKSHMVDVGRYSRMKPAPHYTSSTSVHYVSAADFATIYNSAPLLAQGINGSGVTIGIVGRSDILLSDVQSYRQMMGLTPHDPNFIHAGQDNGINPGDDGESDLDVEISGGMAPNATVDFVIGTPTFLVDGITNSFEYLIENNLSDIISSSYGDCEGNEGTGGNLFNSEMFEQGAAQGISIFIANGDNGPAGCDDQNDSDEVLGYAAPAEGSTWYSVAVGGTEFNEGANVANYWNPSNSGLNSALTYIPEVPWNEAKGSSYNPAGESLSGLWSGSGAISAYYLQPPWQRGSGVPTSDPTLTLASGATGLWVTSITLTNPGAGYTTAPTMTFSGGGCLTEPYTTGAVAISGGAISSITFPIDGTQGGTVRVGQGFGCTSVPTIAFTAAPSGGTTATATATVAQMQNILPLVSGVPHRYTPDLSLNAASGHDATFFCSEGVCELNSSGGLVDAGLVGGTSVAAPSMAGVQALINQANGGRQGMPGYTYYSLSAAQSESACNSSTPPANGNTCAFHDITTGNNFICGESTCTTTSAKIGFGAVAGYDLATGLGSPNAANLASQWSSVVFNSSNTTLGLSQTTFAHGTSITLSGTVGAASGTPTGDVAFIVSSGAIGDTNNEDTGAQNGPVAFATLSGGSYSASLDNLPAGTYYVTARYGGDETFASSLSSGVQVTVSAEGSGLTITPYALSGSACTITAGSTFAYASDILINLNVAGISGAGAPTGTVALSLDGNPLSTLTLDPNGNAFAFSGAITSSNCLYDYNFANVTTIPGGSHTLTASYSGDGTYNASTATPVGITVSQLTPTLTLTPAGGGTITSGQSLSLTGTFGTLTPINGNSTLSSPPSGVVTFTDTTTSTVLGTAPIVSFPVFSGNNYTYQAYATLATTGITTTGANSITASFAGDTNWAPVTSAAVTFTVATGTSTTVAVTSSGNPTTLGGRPTFTATVTTATAGAVAFYDGSYYLGAGSAVAAAHTSTFKVGSATPFVGGTHNITAVYQGSGSTLGSVSPAFVETVTQGTNTINLAAKTSGTTPQNYTFAAVLTPSSTTAIYAPNQSVVNFFDGATNIGSAQPITVTANQGGYALWAASLTVNGLSAGTHTITAQYSDVNYSLATSNAQTVTVGGTQTLSFTSAPPASAAYGSNFTVAASATSSLTPAYTSFGGCSNSGATYTMTSGTGTCLVIVNQAGNSSYGAAPEIQQSVSATLAANTVTFTTPAPASAEYGSSFTVAASGLGTGAITYTSDGVVCTNSGATFTMISGTGTCTVSASQAADKNYASASATPESVTAAPAVGSVGVSLTSGTNPSNSGASVTFTATVTSDTGAVKGRRTTKRPRDLNGSVSWSGNTGCASSGVSGNSPETATCTTTSLPAGSNTVTATYTANDSNHTTASGSVSQDVQLPNTVTFTTPAPSSAEYGSSFTVAASGLGTGAITYTSDGVVCSNSGATYTMISGTGTCTVTATQAADNYYASANASESVTAAPAVGSVSVALTSGSNPSTYGDSITFTATVTSDTGAVKGRRTTKRPRDLNGSVTWSGNTGCASGGVSGNSPETATCTTSILGGGSDTVTATYTASDSNHTTASNSVSQTVNQANDTVTFTTPAPASAEYGSSFTVAASGLGTGAITYTSDGVVCTNSGATYTMIAGSGTCTVTATQAADSNYNAGSASESVTAEPAQGSVSVSLTSGTNPSTYGDSITFTATVSSDTGAVKGRKTTKRPRDLNGSVSWSGNTGCASSSVSGNPTQTATCTTSILAGGTNTVTATYTASDSNHTTASGSINQTVNVGNNSVTFNTQAPATAEYGSSFTVAASGLGTGAITYTSDGVVCTNSGATYTMISGTGTCTVTATQAADINYNQASASESVTAEPAVGSVSVTLTSGSNPSTYGDSITFTATVSSDTGAVKGRRSTKRPRDLNGSVSWSGNTGCSASGVSGISPETATCTTSILGGGSNTVTATYTASDSNHTTASGSIGQTVHKANQTITVTTSAPSTAIDGSSFTIVASASSGLSVTYTSGGSCTNSGGTYTITAGSRANSTCTEDVFQTGNSNYNAAIEMTETTTVKAPLTPEMTFVNNGTSQEAYGATFTVTASSSNDTSVPVISTSTGTICQVTGSSASGTTVTATVQILVGTGSCKLTANWPITTVYKADSKLLTVTAKKASAAASLTGAPASASNGSNFTVTATSVSTATPTITATPATVCTVGSVTSNGPGSYQATVTMIKATGTCHTKAAYAATTDYDAGNATELTTATN